MIILELETLRGSKTNSTGDMFPLPSAWTPEAGLFSKIGIPDLCDTSVIVISGTYTDLVCSSLPHHEPRETVLVVGHYTGLYYFAVLPDGPR